MVEMEPTVALAVETIDAQAFGIVMARRQASITALLTFVVSYAAKRLLLEQAVAAEEDAAENLRTFATITVTQGATGEELTIERRAARLICLRRTLFAARQHFVFVRSKFYS